MNLKKSMLKILRKKEKDRPTAGSTLHLLRGLIFMENLVCINRNYLINCKKLRRYGNIVFYIPLFTIIGAIIIDTFIIKVETNFIGRLLQLLMLIQIVYLSNSAKNSKTFDAIDKLDKICGETDECIQIMKKKVVVITTFSAISLVINIYATQAFEVDKRPITAVLYTILTIIYDIETDFLRTLIEGFNLRLQRLIYATPQEGSKVYRYVLLAAAQMGEENNSKILLMLFVVLVKTVFFASQFLIVKAEMSWIILIFWRQGKSLLSLWFLCLSASNTAGICKCLALQIGQRLALEPCLKKETNPNQHKLTRRWYLSILREKPMYMSTTLPSLDLNIPLGLLDVCVNYLLIIVQIYSAHK